MEIYPEPVTRQCTKKILDQMNNRQIYKISKKNDEYEFGFFCNITYKKTKKTALITKSNILDEISEQNTLVIFSDDDSPKTIELSDLFYQDSINDLAILEVKDYKNLNPNIIDIDDYINNIESDIYYQKESIYIIQYKKDNVLVSYGIINEIKNDSVIEYSCNINPDSKISLILNFLIIRKEYSLNI